MLRADLELGSVVPSNRSNFRILILVHSLARGGAERMTVDLARALADRGFMVTVLTFAPPDTDFFSLDRRVDRQNVSGPETFHLGPVGRVVAASTRIIRLRKLLRELKPAIALGMMSTGAMQLAVCSIGLGVKVFGSERVYPPALPLGTFKELLRCVSYGLLSGVVCQTEQSAKWVRRNTLARNVHVIPNHVVHPLPRHEPILAVEEFALSGGNIVLGVGRLEPQKQFDKLILAFFLAARDRRDWDLIILGDGSMRQALETQVRELGLQGRVHLPGAVGNVGDWYERADIYALSSSFEGFPNSLLEAMSHGVPSVAFDCPTGPADMIVDGENGLLVSLDHTDDLAKALERLITSPELRTALGEQARLVRTRFGAPLIIDRWLNAFRVGARP